MNFNSKFYFSKANTLTEHPNHNITSYIENTKTKIKQLAKTVAEGASGTYLAVVGAKLLAGKSIL